MDVLVAFWQCSGELVPASVGLVAAPWRAQAAPTCSARLPTGSSTYWEEMLLPWLRKAKCEPDLAPEGETKANIRGKWGRVPALPPYLLLALQETRTKVTPLTWLIV